MIKKCVILNGTIISVGDWDYQIRQVEIESAKFDEEGAEIKKAVYEEQATNQLPEGAVIEERDYEYDADRGWYESGTLPEPTLEQRNRADIDYIGMMTGVL